MKGQADAAGHCTECCERKTVGGYNYTFVERAPGGHPDCITGCRYNRDDDGTGPYCFASGPYKSTCTLRVVEITNYCYKSYYCYGTIIESNADIINYDAVANSTVCEKVKSTVTDVSATCYFPQPDGSTQPLLCTPYDHETGPFSWNFNIDCKDGGDEKCIVRAKN